MLHSIRILGRHVESLWKKQGYRRPAFPALATKALEQAQLHQALDPRQVLDWCLRSRSLPRQLELTKNFGDPPVTLFWSSKGFLIDAYFWLKPKISIHDHSFSGAFVVLEGSSLQCLYGFDKDESFGKSLRLGSLRLRLQERLRKGDVRPIVSGEEFIHEVWHIGCPTVSIVLRTTTDGVPQHRYYRDELSLRTSQAKDPGIVKRTDFLHYLHESGSRDSEGRFLELLKDADAYSGFHYALAHVQASRDTDRALSALRRGPRRHRPWLEALARTFRYERIVKGVDWERCTDERARFLLALLLSSPDRRSIFALLRQEDPATAPPQQIVRALGRLVRDGTVDFELPPLALDALRLLLEDRSTEEVYEGLRRAGKLPPGLAVEAKCGQLCAAVRRVPLLKPLFA